MRVFSLRSVLSVRSVAKSDAGGLTVLVFAPAICISWKFLLPRRAVSTGRLAACRWLLLQLLSKGLVTLVIGESRAPSFCGLNGSYSVKLHDSGVLICRRVCFLFRYCFMKSMPFLSTPTGRPVGECARIHSCCIVRNFSRRLGSDWYR